MTTPENNQFFRHIDGGLYRFIAEAYHSDDASEVIVYEHLWPFKPSIWVRPAHEFHARFTPVPAAEIDAAMSGDQQVAQEQVNSAKALRRSTR